MILKSTFIFLECFYGRARWPKNTSAKRKPSSPRTPESSKRQCDQLSPKYYFSSIIDPSLCTRSSCVTTSRLDLEKELLSQIFRLRSIGEVSKIFNTWVDFFSHQLRRMVCM